MNDTRSFTLPSKSAEFASVLRGSLKNSSHSVVGIQAPTGVGKTTVMVDLFRETPRTLMIMPTQLACEQWLLQKKPTDRMTIMNGSRALDYCIRHGGLGPFRTILLDEAHVDSREYFAIRKVMQMANRHRDPFQYFFISATLPVAFLRQSFPDLHVLSYDAYRPYKVDIRYDGKKDSVFVHQRDALDMAMSRLIQLDPVSVRRVLVFTATHQDCEDMARRIEGVRKKIGPVMGDCPILVLHGGLEPEEKEKVKHQLRTLPSYILIATNIAESSVTIPDIDVVVDTGFECRVQGSNYVTVTHASKMSLIQRAGRAGRTKDGIVYRLMSEKLFDSLQEFSTEDHDMDPIVIRCLLHGCNARKMFGRSIDGNLTFLRSMGIHTTTPRNKLAFLEGCGLGTIPGSLLWNLVGSKTGPKILSPRDIVWIAMLIVVMEQYDKKVLNWVYYPRDARSGRMDPSLRYLDQEFKPAVQYEGDMLVTIGRMLLSIASYGKAWRDAASGISLNQKNVREFMSDWRRVFRHLGPPSSLPLWKEKDPVDVLLEVLGIEKQETMETQNTEKGRVPLRPVPVPLDAGMVRRGRQFFLNQSILYGPKLTHRFYEAPWNYEWPDNVVHEEEDGGNRTEARFFDSVYHDDQWRFPHNMERSPGFDTRLLWRMPRMFHPLRLRNESFGSLTLWTNVPDEMNCRDILVEGFPSWEKKQAAKEDVRIMKKRIVEELNETIALMPPSDNVGISTEMRFSGGYLWKEAEENFMSLVGGFF